MENRVDIRDEPAKSIFLDAQEIASPEARAAYLDRRCGADQRLRGEVETLLRHHERLGDYLEQPACEPGPTQDIASDPRIEGPGTIIGTYKLLEAIGEGGMGVVYMAEQTQPVRRKVALKIIKPGMDTRQVIARFEAERQALALMDHPNIARVLDAGATGSGRPYFVMELVKGIPITDYCDQAHHSIPERLDLFMQVCKAVQHAHQKGIIHRDIKPTNVLITLHDGVPVPKVIDFGVAKATGQQLTEKTLFTAFAQMVGTPLYMSPEQAALAGLDIDTRSDIYSLGVLLYELLTGTTPFDAETFRTAAYDEIRRIIREQEPPKPSTRISTLGAALSTVLMNRHAELRQLERSDARGTRLDRDEGAREGPDSSLRDGQRFRGRRDAVPHRPDGRGVSAVGRLSAAEVRAAKPGGPDDGRPGRRGTVHRRRRQHVASRAGEAGRRACRQPAQARRRQCTAKLSTVKNNRGSTEGPADATAGPRRRLQAKQEAETAAASAVSQNLYYAGHAIWVSWIGRPATWHG